MNFRGPVLSSGSKLIQGHEKGKGAPQQVPTLAAEKKEQRKKAVTTVHHDKKRGSYVRGTGCCQTAKKRTIGNGAVETAGSLLQRTNEVSSVEKRSYMRTRGGRLQAASDRP